MVDTEKEEMPLEKISTVKDFSNVFSDDLSGLSPDRKIEFEINIVPEVTSISKFLYRMTPAELKELKEQL